MSFAPRLDIRTAQTLVMTPQLQQAIKLLQMSNQELAAFVAEEIESNPLLERGEAEEEGSAPQEATPPAPLESAEPLPLTGLDEKPAEPAEDYGENDWGGMGEKTSHGGSFEDSDFDAAQNVAEQPNLRRHLLEQIDADIVVPTERMIAGALLELLDESGYLPAELEVVRAQLGASPEVFNAVIARLQACDPVGVFARSLKECLTLQLKDKNRLDPAMKILLDHLDLVGAREYKALIRLCRVDDDVLAEMIADIKGLNPRPAAAIGFELTPPVVPDVILKPRPGGAWHVELNTDNLPRVLANSAYYTQVQGGVRGKPEKEYLGKQWQQANWLVKALHQRATTILKIAAEIVKQQDAFFVSGVQHLKPLVLKDIATAVEMHESTVSRVTQNKYIATPRGLFELKYFFTTALARRDGQMTVSSEAVRERIRKLIEGEKAKEILSDDHIAAILKVDGITVARRTVAKYREAMHIATSAQRRREKR